jgi:hypothetical protein
MQHRTIVIIISYIFLLSKGNWFTERLLSGDIPLERLLSGDIPLERLLSGDIPLERLLSGDIPLDNYNKYNVEGDNWLSRPVDNLKSDENRFLIRFLNCIFYIENYSVLFLQIKIFNQWTWYNYELNRRDYVKIHIYR